MTSSGGDKPIIARETQSNKDMKGGGKCLEGLGERGKSKTRKRGG